MQLNPYLTFNGTCETAFKFYAQVLGGKIEAMIPHEGTPMADHVSPEWRSKIMHARLSIGDRLLMGSDAPPDRREAMQGFSVTLSLDDPTEAERMFGAWSTKERCGCRSSRRSGRPLRHARRSVRNAVDDQLRAAKVIQPARQPQ